MQHMIITLWDKTAETTTGPIFATPNLATAMRDFTAILSDKRTQPGQYPADFELKQLGTINVTTGEITAIQPTVVATGSQWLHQREPDQLDRAV